MDKAIRPVFTLELNYKIIPGLVIVGKYDGTHPCITAATTTDKVLIHSPHRRNTSVTGRLLWSESNREIATLNINQPITCLAVGKIIPDEEKDILILGTSTHILAYHVHDNKDVFYTECPDGIKSICVGNLKTSKSGIVMVGGNSSVHGYDHQGNEIFWTVVGDIVTSLILMDYDEDGHNELIVSSEDFNIRVFKGDRMITEYTETEVVTNLVALPDHRFAYSVSNGTVGVYEKDVRLWRVKSKHFAVAINFYDLLSQSTPQLITGWSNGKMDCRSIKTGEVLFKDTLNSGIAGVVEADYRSIGKTDIICVSSEGEVRGYTTTKTTLSAEGSVPEQDIIRELLTHKQTLLMELRHYENNTKYNENILNETDSYENSGVIPSNTRLQITINTDEKSQKPHVEVYISTNNSTIIRAVLIFAEGIFKGETHVIHPPVSKLKSEISVPLILPKDNPVDIHVKALIGYPNSVQYHVFEITRQLPKFSMYTLRTKNDLPVPESRVQFKVNERIQRICMWINQNFLLNNDVEFESGPNFTLTLKCLRDNTNLVMVFEISGKVTFWTSNMSLAADLVQSMTSYLNIDQLEHLLHNNIRSPTYKKIKYIFEYLCSSQKASFPKEEEILRTLMENLSEIQNARLRLDTDVADSLGQIRTLIIKAEDSRLNDLKQLPRIYHELNSINTEILNGYNIRLKNYDEGVNSMKKINSIIQQASRLRGIKFPQPNLYRTTQNGF